MDSVAHHWVWLQHLCNSLGLLLSYKMATVASSITSSQHHFESRDGICGMERQFSHASLLSRKETRSQMSPSRVPLNVSLA